MTQMQQPWPDELRLSADKTVLSVTFDDGARFDLPAELLRVMSPSAEVQGHSPSQRKTVAGKKDVAITRLEPVGNYAVRIVFSDRHDTGIYSWAYLRDMGERGDQLWREYRDELAAKGLSRG